MLRTPASHFTILFPLFLFVLLVNACEPLNEARITPTPTDEPLPAIAPGTTAIIDICQQDPTYPGCSTTLGTPNPAEMNVSQWESISPDGDWIAKCVYASPKPEVSIGVEYVQLVLQNTASRITWTVVEMWRETGLGYTIPQAVKWSQSGRYFYFTNVPVVEGCRALTPNGSDLQQVNLETGEVVEILPPTAFWISLSPHETWVAYIKQGSQSLILHDLNTAEEREIELNPGKEFDAGNIVWSPEEDMLALTLAIQPCTGSYSGSGIYAESTSILIVNTSTLGVRTVVRENARRLVTSAWNEVDKIELKDPEGNPWTLNVQTGEITQP